MDVLTIIAVALLSGACCWVLGWAASESSHLERLRQERRIEDNRKRRDLW